MPAELTPLRLDPILSVETMEVQELYGRVDYFRDGREGVDRWGRERRNLKACGSGWDDYVCPAYAEEACPGDNPGNRSLPLRVFTCDLNCGGCGGGGRVDTMAYCGYSKGKELFAGLYDEFGGSLRLDRLNTDAPVVPCEPYGVPYIPSVEWGAKKWMADLHEAWGTEYPALATSVRTATPGNRKQPTPLSERLGDYQGRVIVHGLTKDDILDDKWEERDRLMKWCRSQEVDTMVVPQFSYYDEDQNCMAIANVNRQFQWYLECRELGFPNVAMDWPPWAVPWLRAEYIDFAIRNDVKMIAPSYQTLGTRGSLDAHFAKELMDAHKVLPMDVSFLVFGTGSPMIVTAIHHLLKGRQVTFATTDAYAKAIFFKLSTDSTAPPGWSKGETFAWNVLYNARMFSKLTGQPLPPGHEKAKPARASAGTRPAAKAKRTRQPR